MRILCLHGRRQSAEIFSQRLQRLSKRLQQLQRSSGLEITLVFSEAPHLMASRGDDSVTMPTWWRSDGRGKTCSVAVAVAVAASKRRGWGHPFPLADIIQ